MSVFFSKSMFTIWWEEQTKEDGMPSQPGTKATSSRSTNDVATLLSRELDDKALNPLLLREGHGNGGRGKDGWGGNHGWVAMRLQ